MKHRQTIVRCRVGITALAVGLALIGPWRGVFAAGTTWAAGKGTTGLIQPPRGDGLPPSLLAALQCQLGRAHRARALLGEPALTAPFSGTTWNQQAEITATDGIAYDNFGYSVAISGNVAAVGAWYKNAATGAAYVFLRSGGTWSQQAELTATDAAPNDLFGHSVAISGGVIVVGAYSKNAQTGAAYVFARQGTTWSQQAKLTASDGAYGDEFGWSLAFNGATLVVGAIGHNNGASGVGAVYVFARNGGIWYQQAELTASDGTPNDLDFFGNSVSINRTTIAVGAYGKNNYTGAAYVFVRNGTTWSQQAEITATDAAQGDEFAISVGLSRNALVIGAPDKNNYTGAAYIYVRSGSAWSQQAELIPNVSGGSFGYSVGISMATAVIGALSYIGAAYVFVRNGTAWSQQATLSASNGAPGDYFGWAVAISGGTAIVGATGKYTGAGAAYVFVRSGTRSLWARPHAAELARST